MPYADPTSERARACNLASTYRYQEAFGRRPALCEQCGQEYEALVFRLNRGQRFCSRRCNGLARKAARMAAPRNRMLHARDAYGYERAWRPDHPHANQKGYIAESRVIAEAVLRKILPGSVVIHHANGKRADNRHENLVICESQSYHILLHNRARRIERLKRLGGNPAADSYCPGCKGVKAQAEFHRNANTNDGCDCYCKECSSKKKAAAYLRRHQEKGS